MLPNTKPLSRIIFLALVGAALIALGPVGTAAPADEAAQILETSGVKGGLIVHLGMKDGRLTAALRANERYLVHGLGPDDVAVAAARAHMPSKGLAGTVSVETWTAKGLPYADNMVNLAVVEDPGAVDMAEVMRVLAPNGVVCARTGDGWTKTVKPWPKEMDEWTHTLHGPDNNAVAHDSLVGPPRHVQWLADPRHARSHEHLASVSAVVSANGRLFSIVDEGPALAVALPARWWLVARDAFNGLELWRLPVGPWESHLNWFRSGPGSLARRLVAVGDRVYVTRGYGRPVEALDAATGREIRTYAGTKKTREILCDNGVLYLVIGPPDAQSNTKPPAVTRDRLAAVEADTGKTRWTLEDEDTETVMPTTPAVAGGRMYFQNAKAVVCLDAGTGRVQWRTPRATGKARISQSPPTLVVYDDVVLSADPTAPPPPEDPDEVKPPHGSYVQGNAGELVAFSAKTGESLWKTRCYPNFQAPVDVIVADGVLWMGQLWSVVNMGVTSVRDVRTGKIVRRRPADNPNDIVVSHHRCHRFRATDKYLVLSRAGTDLLDLRSLKLEYNHWIRGTCQHGPIPCNGLIYEPPHSCACYTEAMVHGFMAVAASRAPAPEPCPALEKGPAYGQADAAAAPVAATDWPTYRADAARSSAVPAETAPAGTSLRQAWERELGGRLSAPTIAGGTVFVSEINAHRLHALDAATGQPRWTFTAGGRVDSPPTVSAGCAVFGSADGWVYCLRASDGQLAWRARCAPNDQRVVISERLESIWPVPGSVLVRDGQVWAAAGRNGFLDGGLYLQRIDRATGRTISTTRVDSRDPKTGLQPAGTIEGFNMAGAQNDVLSGDGKHVFMRHVVFGADGARLDTRVPHLFSPLGFLDGSWWHRSYWLLGDRMEAGFRDWQQASFMVPTGQLLCHSPGDGVYGFGRVNSNQRASHVGVEDTFYRLFAVAEADMGSRPPGQGPTSAVKYRWTRRVPLLGRAMLVAGRTLFVAGPPDHVARESEKGLAAVEGRKGGAVWAVSGADGGTLAECKLDSPPVFDGMAAAGGKLFLSLQDGRVICLKGKP